MNTPLAIAMLLLLSATSAKAQQGDFHLLLELWVNGRTKHLVTDLTLRDNLLLAKARDLTQAGIKTSPTEQNENGEVDLYKLQGVTITISEIEQRLLLTIPYERMEAQHFDLRPSDAITKTSEGTTGFMGRYDIVGTMDNIEQGMRSASIGTMLGGTFFTPHGNATSTGFTQHQRGKDQAVRLESSFEINEPETLRRWVVGDTTLGSLNWSRSLRFAGLQLSTDFTLRPDLNTMPLPAFFGETAIPANVDVFINASRVFESGLDAGPFQINNLPIITGSGQASVVVRDVLGRETSVLLPFYASNSLLRKDLSAYSLDTGAIRRGYGEESFSYDTLMASGTYRRGVTNTLTLETHGEAAKDVQLAGAGAVLSIGSYGIIHPAIAISHSNNPDAEGMGTLYSFSFESQLNPFGFFGNISTTSGNYTDLASIGGLRPSSFRMQLGTTLGLEEYGSLNASYIQSRELTRARARLANLSYTRSFGNGLTLGTTGFYDIGRSNLIAQAFASMSIEGLLGNLSTQQSKSTGIHQASLTKPANPDGGVGYRLSTIGGDSTIHQADATWIGEKGSLTGALASNNGTPAARISASGGLAILGGDAYATRSPNGAIALVRTGKPGTGVFQENRQVATTDENGEALITNLVPFAANRIGIDPAGYSFATIVEDTKKTIAPNRSSGTVVDFTPIPRYPALLLLKLEQGGTPPAGAAVELSSSTSPLTLGHGGKLFIPDLRSAITGKVRYANKQCVFDAVPPKKLASGGIPRLGPIDCLMSEAS